MGQGFLCASYSSFIFHHCMSHQDSEISLRLCERWSKNGSKQLKLPSGELQVVAAWGFKLFFVCGECECIQHRAKGKKRVGYMRTEGPLLSQSPQSCCFHTEKTVKSVIHMHGGRLNGLKTGNTKPTTFFPFPKVEIKVTPKVTLAPDFKYKGAKI